MPLNRRLANLEETLDSLYETLGESQKRLAYANDIFEKNSIKQRIRKEVLPELRQCEAEYWKILAQEARSCVVAEVDASHAIVDVVREVELIENQSSTNYPDKLMRLLLEIREKLNEPGQPAAAKAKLALPLVPGILSYEVELDTESSLRRAFQPIRRLFKGALEKN
jgi:phage anti-repressor protein